MVPPRDSGNRPFSQNAGSEIQYSWDGDTDSTHLIGGSGLLRQRTSSVLKGVFENACRSLERGRGSLVAKMNAALVVDQSHFDGSAANVDP